MDLLPENQDKLPNDSEFSKEMAQMEADSKVVLGLSEYEITKLIELLAINGLQPEQAWCPESDDLVTYISTLSKGDIQDDRIDFGVAFRLSLMAAFRYSIAMYDIARRRYDPTYDKDPDSPVGA